MAIFDRLARMQVRNPAAVIAAAAVITLVLGAGITQIRLQTDFQESLPDTLDPVRAQDAVEAKFGSQDAIIVLFETGGGPAEDGFVTDVRDPRMVHTLLALEDELEREPIVGSVSSMADLFDVEPNSTADVKRRLAATDASFTNRDFTGTTMVVTLSEDPTEDNVREATRVLRENIDQAPTYPGIEVSVTGLPVVRTTMSSVLVTDSATTIAVASVLILGLLALARGVAYGPITFIPLFSGLLWTLGAMGYLGIPLTVATIALGSMILGLGVEYGSFITERVLEEMRDEGQSVEAAVATAVPNTGRAIVGSASTDGVGFLALLLASISFVRDLGVTLALGEFLTVTAALAITPAFIVAHERWFA